MPLYGMRWMSKDAASKMMAGRSQHGEAPARELVEGCGGRMHRCSMLGEYDGLAVVEFPDDAAAAAASMRASASGAFLRFEMHPLLTTEEAQRAMQMLKDSTTAYRAPNA
jgi:uncharacterized protein with GYD domain